MTLFKDMLHADQSLIKNEDALNFEFVPKLIPYRDHQQFKVANCIKPLFQKRDGKHILIHGNPGVGKTVAVKHIFRELEEESEEIIPIFINCWQKNTSFKIILEICEQLGYKFTQNKKSDELFKIIKQMLNKQPVVFCFDEIDKLEEVDFIYTILEEIYKKTIILISNFKSWFSEVDPRIKSRLLPETIEFPSYSLKEITGILQQRANYAFIQDTVESSALDLIAKKTFEQEDVRKGIFLLKESGLLAESSSSKKITEDHAKRSIEKLADFTIKNSDSLKDETRFILSIIKKNNNNKIGDLFKIYEENKGLSSYKTFQRHIQKLEKAKFVTLTKTEGGAQGNTTIIHIKQETKLTDF